MPTWMGIDIGTTAVKVAVVKSAYRKTSVVALVAVDVAEAGGPAEAIRQATAAAFGPKGISSDGIAVALDGARCAIRSLTLPASAQKQLTEVLGFELEAQVPFEMENAVFDYRQVARPARAAGAPEEREIGIIAAVARTDDVRARIELVKTAIGHEPERVGAGAFPLANLAGQIPVLAEEGPIVILDLGTKSSEVLVLRGGEPVFARTLSFGTFGLPAGAPRLAREIRVTMAAYRALGGAPPSRVYLCGGGAFVSQADSYLQQDLRTADYPSIVVEFLPGTGLDLSALDPARQNDLPRFAKAVGLALGLGRGQGLNLRRGAVSYERGFAWMRDKVPVLAGLAAVIFVSFAFSAWARLHALSSEHDTLEAALGIVTKEVLGEEKTDAEETETLIKSKTELDDEDPMPHADAFDVLIALSERIPDSMKHDIEDLDFQKGHVAIHAIVNTIPDAQAITEFLKSERCFKEVKNTRTVQQPGSDRQKYAMEFDVKCPEDVRTKKKPSTGSSSSSSGPASSGPGGR